MDINVSIKIKAVKCTTSTLKHILFTLKHDIKILFAVQKDKKKAKVLQNTEIFKKIIDNE